MSKATLAAAGALIVALLAIPAEMVGQPTPGCPKHQGWTLCAVFTGVMVFQETNTTPLTYMVNIPAVHTDDVNEMHEPYIRFKTPDKVFSQGFRESTVQPCQGYSSQAQYVRLDGHRLTIDSANADVNDLTRPDELCLAPLRELARIADPNATFSNACAQMPVPPDPDPMAGCISLSRGILKPLLLTGEEWDFKTFYGWKKSGIHKCVADGVLLILPLKPGTNEISILGAAPYRAELRLKAYSDQPTEIVIGNTLHKDIFCPNQITKEKKDVHFTHQYALVSGNTVQYIPQLRLTDQDRLEHHAFFGVHVR